MDNEFLPDKKCFTDSMGKFITQGLFLELGYGEYSYYTLKDYDHEYNGKTYPSLKRLYLEMEDPTEYTFATKYLSGWRHWQRILENKSVRVHINEWREELEVKLRSKGVGAVLSAAKAGSYQAAKWMADRGWEQHGVGRPKKEDIESQKKFEEKVSQEYGADIHRLFPSEKVS